MKKKISLFAMAAILLISALTGCGGKAKAADYFSFKENTVYEYVGTGYDENQVNYGNVMRFVDYTDKSKNLIQVRSVAPFTSLVELYDLSNADELKVTNYFYTNAFFNLLGSEPEIETIGMIGPVKKGTKWNRANIGNPGDDFFLRSEITGENIEVTVPYGTFKTIEVTNLYDNSDHAVEGAKVKFKTVEYYAKGIGLIKKVDYNHVFEQEDEILISELNSITEGIGCTIPIRIFYPVDSETEINTGYEFIEHTFKTNENVYHFFEEALKNFETEGIQGIIGKNVKINQIDFDYGRGKVVIDFSKELVEEMTKDAKMEEATIQSLVNTFAFYFDCGLIGITVDGGDYVSDHKTIPVGEVMNIIYEEQLEDETGDESNDESANLEDIIAG